MSDHDYSKRPNKVTYCSKCVYPSLAVYITMEEGNVCSGCRVSGQKGGIDWEERQKLLIETIKESKIKSGANYDCIIPVSGGKDSYFQTHFIKNVLGFNPLLVTYHGNNYLPEGEYNLERMREVFGVDHLIFRPSTSLLIKMNRAGFKLQGDMNWHAHCGIFTYPVQIAVKFKIPILIWGEHGPTDLGGQVSLHDMIEMSARKRLEHDLRGFDWYDFVGLEGIKEEELLWAKYPSDEELEEIGVRGLYLNNFLQWDANKQVMLVMEQYRWKAADQEFERTYRKFSNLDDMHENGIHDYMKYIKFGYGRATDHASKDIRLGKLTRAQGVEMVKKYDHVKPRRDLERWLKYVNMTEEEFDTIADTFRDPRVWWQENGVWKKDNLWD